MFVYVCLFCNEHFSNQKTREACRFMPAAHVITH